MGSVIREYVINSSAGEYSVLIGRGIFGDLSKNDLYLKCDKCGVFINERVYSLYKDLVDSTFSDKKCDIIVQKDGEEHKSFSECEDYLNILLKKKFTRKSLIVAIGGGVTGDFAGFLASVYMRGVKIIQVPTTLLAMVDSSIGGKVAVNLSSGKNIAGSFFPPSLVLTDVTFLETLNDDEFRNGLAESIKHAYLGEMGLYRIFKDNSYSDLRGVDLLAQIVSLAAGYKVGIVNKDEKEQNIRAFLNFGHTTAHAIESVMNYSGISHGEAVAVGMDVAARISYKMGYISSEEMNDVVDMISKFGLIRASLSFAPEEIVGHMIYDKKNENNTILFVLLKGLFNPIYGCKVPGEIIEASLTEYLESRDDNRS